MNEKNKFHLKPGQWTDDSAMGLCLADTLLANGCYEGCDIRVRYHNWWFRGYNNAFGNDDRKGSVGLGGNVSKSLWSMIPNQAPTPCYEAQTKDAGNGTIMRLAPVPVFFFRDPTEAAKASAKSSFATHPGPIAAAACAFQGYLIARAIGRHAEASNDAAVFFGTRSA
jgi:ADP-ribosyl-[dinitrogen reductase] hydrolase